ncbi:MAG: hypothetical protein JXM74_04605 [Fusobacteriaceae bacterium]|nr:hypothetical protein [Fusobacteriaceae bacterium]MBN2838016.1 hypothetical protein [Fusobacteriaceae bacterium]
MEKYGFYVVLIVILSIIFYMVQKGKKEIIKKSAMIAVEKVAEHFFSLDNSEKLEKAVNITYQLLPKWVRVLISKKLLTAIVEETYEIMKNYLTKKLNLHEQKAKSLALMAVGKTLGEAVEFSYNGDKNLTSNDQLKSLDSKSLEKVNSIWGQLKYQTNFKDEKDLMAEMGFKRVF